MDEKVEQWFQEAQSVIEPEYAIDLAEFLRVMRSCLKSLDGVFSTHLKILGEAVERRRSRIARALESVRADDDIPLDIISAIIRDSSGAMDAYMHTESLRWKDEILKGAVPVEKKALLELQDSCEYFIYLYFVVLKNYDLGGEKWKGQ